jgi:hypothetical protein
MDADAWARSDDWPVMLRSLPRVDGSRKLRLWCVAWARAIIAAPARPPHLSMIWFIPEQIARYSREVDAGELYADGLINRKQLRGERNPLTGGPHNVFHLPAGLSRLTTAHITSALGAFSREFRIPSARDLAALLRDIFGNPFRPVAFDKQWRTDTAVSIARGMYDSRDFGAMPILADALQDAGCDNEDVLNHCRGPGPHVRGCWVVDLVLGKA